MGRKKGGKWWIELLSVFPLACSVDRMVGTTKAPRSQCQSKYCRRSKRRKQ